MGNETKELRTTSGLVSLWILCSGEGWGLDVDAQRLGSGGREVRHVQRRRSTKKEALGLKPALDEVYRARRTHGVQVSPRSHS